RVGLDVQAAAAAAVAGAALGVDGEMADLQGQARTAGVQTPVEHQRAAHAPVSGGHAQQVAGAAPGAVPVFGEGGQVDVVGGEGGPVETGGPHLFGEDLPHRGTGG